MFLNMRFNLSITCTNTGTNIFQRGARCLPLMRVASNWLCSHEHPVPLPASLSPLQSAALCAASVKPAAAAAAVAAVLDASLLHSPSAPATAFLNLLVVCSVTKSLLGLAWAPPEALISKLRIPNIYGYMVLNCKLFMRFKCTDCIPLQ